MGQSESQKALKTIRIDERGLPKEWLPLKIAREERRRHERDSRIYRDWLASENPEAVVPVLAERWGLESGHIRNIIEKMQSSKSVVASMAAEIEVLRQSKRRQIIEDGEEYRAELDAQVSDLEQQRADGERWVAMELAEESSEKFGAVTKIKKVRIDTEIKRLKDEIIKSHKTDSESIERYIPKQVQTLNLNLNKQADEEFKEQFARMGAFRNPEKTETEDITNLTDSQPTEGENAK